MSKKISTKRIRDIFIEQIELAMTMRALHDQDIAPSELIEWTATASQDIDSDAKRVYYLKTLGLGTDAPKDYKVTITVTVSKD
jgi:hypothetical protein